jgi:hypothetical protein
LKPIRTGKYWRRRLLKDVGTGKKQGINTVRLAAIYPLILAVSPF